MSSCTISTPPVPRSGRAEPTTSAADEPATVGAASRSLTSLAYRAGVAVLGGVIVVVGLLLVPLPGPGWAIVFVGTSVLGREFPWAARLSDALRQQVRVVVQWLRRRGRGQHSPAAH